VRVYSQIIVMMPICGLIYIEQQNCCG